MRKVFITYLQKKGERRMGEKGRKIRKRKKGYS
jgi:hypothetical protein